MEISVKDFSRTTLPRILKFGTKLDNEQLYCVYKESATYNDILLISPFISPFFFLSKKNCFYRFLNFFFRQGL